MKRLSLFMLAFVLVMGINSCQRLQEGVEFDMGPFKTSFTVPGVTTGGLPLDSLASLLPGSSNATGSSVTFAGNETGSTLVNEITLKEMTMKVTDPATGNLDFLKDIEIWIKATGVTDSVRIAYKNNIPAGTSNLVLDKEDVNLKNYLTKEAVTLTARVKAKAVPPQSDTKIEFSSTFHAKALKL